MTCKTITQTYKTIINTSIVNINSSQDDMEGVTQGASYKMKEIITFARCIASNTAYILTLTC